MFSKGHWKLPTVEDLIKKDFFFYGKKEIIFLTNEINNNSVVACKFTFNSECKTIVEVIEINKDLPVNALIIRNKNEFKQLKDISYIELNTKLKDMNNPIIKFINYLFKF